MGVALYLVWERTKHAGVFLPAVQLELNIMVIYFASYLESLISFSGCISIALQPQ